MWKVFRRTGWEWLRSANTIRVFPTIPRTIAPKTGALKSVSYAMNDPFNDIESFTVEEEKQYDSTHLWVISYSDFMTILMLFFLLLFAHRVWAKKVFWEDQRVAQLRAMQEAQKGIVQRLTRLASVEVQAQRIDIHLPDALLFES